MFGATDVVVAGCLAILLVLECRHPEFVAGELRVPAARARSVLYLGSGFSALVVARQTLAMSELTPVLDISVRFPLAVAAAILVGELFNYWYHYAKHRVGLLWRWHFTHHIAQTYTIALTVHAHFLEIAVGGIASAGLLTVVGFSQSVVNVYLGFFVVGAAYQHSAHDYSLGPLDAVLVSPAYHRLHHAAGSPGVNFGSTITVWDVVFGTAVWPDRREQPPPTGIADGVEPYGFFRELVYFLRPNRRG